MPAVFEQAPPTSNGGVTIEEISFLPSCSRSMQQVVKAMSTLKFMCP